MKQNQRFALRTIAIAAMATAGMGAIAAPAFDANIEFDNTYLNQDRGLSQSGRVEMNVASKVGTDYFVAGRASYMAGRNGAASVDDMWVQFGTATADVKLGRFEAADMFALPRDAIVLYAGGDGNVYRANTLRGRTGAVTTGATAEATDGQNLFHGAVTFNAGGGLSVELGVIETKDKDTAKGIRPIVTYTGGPLTVKAGLEAVKWGRDATGDRNSEVGFGLSGKYDFGFAGVLAHYASIKNAAGNRSSTLGLAFDMPTPGATVGLIFGKTNADAGADYKTQTAYAAYTMPLFGLTGATITGAGSFSKGSGSNDAPDEKGVKLRINYTF